MTQGPLTDKAEARVAGASGGQIAISKDDFALHAKTICERIASGRYKRRYILKRKAT
jgi:hypothetical protein